MNNAASRMHMVKRRKWRKTYCLRGSGFLFRVRDLVVAKAVTVLPVWNNTYPITEKVLLQEATGEVFKIALGEGRTGEDNDTMAVQTCLNLLAKVVGLAINLDVRPEVLFLVLEEDADEWMRGLQNKRRLKVLHCFENYKEHGQI